MSIPLRWQLSDVVTGDPVTECMEIDGLFADRVFPVEPVHERYTLLDCAPSGPLRAAIDGDGPAWLANVAVVGAHVPGRPIAERCPPDCYECYRIGEEMLDVRVVGHRPAPGGAGRFDIDLEGHRRDEDHNAGGTVAPDVAGYRLSMWGDGTGAETPLGECRGVDGLFRERPEVWPPGPPVTLRGCRPGLIGHLELHWAHVRVDGTVHRPAWESRIFGKVVATGPSAFGDGLVDVTLDGPVSVPLAVNEREIWDVWRAGGPDEPNRWAGLDRSGRYLWVRAAAFHRVPTPDRPAGTIYHLDGRHVTDFDGFFCAIGEAINGPGGWFGGDLFWLHENAATGDGGATPGFRLIWHDSEVARAHLVAGYDRKSWQEAVTFDELVAVLGRDGVRVELR